MTDSILKSQINLSNEGRQVQKWIRFLVWKIAIATLLLMAVGSATRVMNAGLACPDWPLCYGQLVPAQQMNLQVFLEWFHRLDASLIGFSTLILVGLSWWFRKELPKWLPWASVGALGLIIFQGVLGGLTVTQLLRFDIVTAHLGAALLFFGSLIVIAICLIPLNEVRSQKSEVRSGFRPDDFAKAKVATRKLRWAGLIAAILVYLQCLLGGLVGSRWALHQCFGGSQLCDVMNSHIIGVFPATIATLTVVWMAWRNVAFDSLLRKLSWVVGGIVVLQVLLGVATFRLHLQVEPLTVAHHTVGAALFGTLVALTTLALRESEVKSFQVRS